METLLVVAAVAAAVLWAALRIRRTVRGASREAPVCAGCASCGVADGPGDPVATCDAAASCDVAACSEARGAGRRSPPA